MNEQTKQYKLLIVDDDKFLLDMYVMRFTASGHEVHSCFSVDEALRELAAGFKPDATVFDITMPGKDGFALLEAIHAARAVPGTKLIALTNQSSAQERERAETLGAHAYLIKVSLEPAQVVSAVEKVIAGK